MADWTIFLDRDGVINRKPNEGGYVKSWDEFVWLDGVFEAVRLLTEVGARTIVVTNQRGVALGKISPATLQSIHDKMVEELHIHGGRIHGVFSCPHDEGQCHCRKPDVGLFLEAKCCHPQIDFSRSFVIGDSAKDIQAGRRLGCRTLLVSTWNAQAEAIRPDAIVPTLLVAVKEYVLPAIASSLRETRMGGRVLKSGCGW